MKYAISFFLCLSLSGCTVGPQMLRTSRTAYNEAIQQTTMEQLLLNIVRLHYHEPPFFLNVGGVNASFTVKHTGKAVASINENVGVNPLNANKLDITGESSFSDTPTITLTPLQDKEYTKLLEPIGRTDFQFLLASPIDLDVILRLCVKAIGGIGPGHGVDDSQEPAKEMSSYFLAQTVLPVPQEDAQEQKPKPKFEKVVKHLSQLRKDRVIVFGLKEKRKALGPALARSEITPEFVLKVYEKGLSLEKTKKVTDTEKVKETEEVKKTEKVTETETEKVKKTVKVKEEEQAWYELTETTTRLTLNADITVDPKELLPNLKVEQRKAWEPLKKLLNLSEEDTFPIYINELPTVSGPPKQKREEINISTRSLLEMMTYLSEYVTVPKAHNRFFRNKPKSGNTTNENEDGNNNKDVEMAPLLAVRSSPWPRKEHLAVRYRDHWYYITDNDVESRVTLALLNELIVRRAGPVQAPVLTLPIGAR